MKKLVILAVCLASLAAAAPASALVAVAPDGSPLPLFQTWIAHSKAPMAPVRVIVHGGGGCPGDPGRGCSTPATPGYPAEIWLQSLLPQTRSDFYHEAGHVFDFYVMTPAARGAFLKISGRVGHPWQGTPGESGRPEEQFAEAYRLCAFGWTVGHALDRTGLGYGWDHATERTQRRACALIDRVGERAGLR